MAILAVAMLFFIDLLRCGEWLKAFVLLIKNKERRFRYIDRKIRQHLMKYAVIEIPIREKLKKWILQNP
jgi:hypothetical protein